MKISRKGMKRDVKLTRVELKPSNRGRNKRGTCAHKMTKGAKPAKAQLQTGYAPVPVTAYRMRLDKV
jgi:hypothetical protein